MGNVERIGDLREGTFQAEESSYKKHKNKKEHGVCVWTNKYFYIAHM